MQDYTLNGVPTSQVSTADIEECLENGIVINDADGWDVALAEQMVMERLRLELTIRKMGLRQ